MCDPWLGIPNNGVQCNYSWNFWGILKRGQNSVSFSVLRSFRNWTPQQAWGCEALLKIAAFWKCFLAKIVINWYNAWIVASAYDSWQSSYRHPEIWFIIFARPELFLQRKPVYESDFIADDNVALKYTHIRHYLVGQLWTCIIHFL